MFLLRLIWAFVHSLFARRADLVVENLALRQQLIVLHRRIKGSRGSGRMRFSVGITLL